MCQGTLRCRCQLLGFHVVLRIDIIVERGGTDEETVILPRTLNIRCDLGRGLRQVTGIEVAVAVIIVRARALCAQGCAAIITCGRNVITVGLAGADAGTNRNGCVDLDLGFTEIDGG